MNCRVLAPLLVGKHRSDSRPVLLLDVGEKAPPDFFDRVTKLRIVSIAELISMDWDGPSLPGHDAGHFLR
jgi:hypothetical protein